MSRTLVPTGPVPAVTGATAVPGSTPRADLGAPGGTIVPGNVSRADVLDAARTTAALADPSPSARASATVASPTAPGSAARRAKTQPLCEDPNDIGPTATLDHAVAAHRETSPTRSMETDAGDRGPRRGTHFHGGHGLVDAGSESPKLRLVPGKVIPGTRYKILRWLGEGGMGVVYEAAHVDIERRSALKILRFDLSQQPRMAQVFRDEARAASRLGSPHIVEIYDFGELPDGRLFFAMELLDGHDLVPTEDEPVMSASRVIAIMRQVSKGLAAAHDTGVVHRDVKPENIIIGDTQERQDVAKIVDFGISAMLAAGQADGGGIAGTPHYMAPEQILGDKFDGRLDVYALGATAYELLVGQPPFDAVEVEDILQQQVNDPPPAPRTVRPDLEIPAQLESVILRCLAKDPDQRYATMAELEAALCEAQIAAGLTTTWDDLAVPMLEDKERHAQIVARMPNASRPNDKRSLLWPIVAGMSTLAAVGLGAFLLFGSGPTDEELSIVEQLTSAAEGAAADQSWVVPTASRPDDPTAYMKVLELEDVEGPAETAADERAVELRRRFATSLVDSADQMWDQGAKPVARQYYLYALTFDDTNEHAFARLDLPLVALSKFRKDARSGNFGEGQKIFASLAAAAAEQNPEKKETLTADAEQALEATPDALSLADAAAIAEAAEGSNIAARVQRRVKRGAGAEVPPEPEAIPDPFEDLQDDGEDPELTIEDPEVEETPVPQTPKPKAKFKPKPRQEQDAGTLLGKAKRDPEKAADLAAQGMKALKGGQRQKAVSLFNQAIAYDRRNAKALMGLSDVYFDTGSNRKAVTYAEKAVAAAPNSGGYRIRLGDAYFKQLRYKDAKEQYERAKSLGSSRADQRLAKVSAKVGG